jgi:hypothetical protein
MAVAIGFSAGTGAMAQTMSKDEYKSARDGIAAEFTAAKADCQSLSANARDICNAKAGGRDNVAKADLEARYKPSEKASYELRVARADADYRVAREICDDKAGNVKDVCVKEAKAAEVAAKADAKSRLKTADARNEAGSARRAADYAVAKEKCDTFAGEVKSNCLNDAKARFGKS